MALTQNMGGFRRESVAAGGPNLIDGALIGGRCGICGGIGIGRDGIGCGRATTAATTSAPASAATSASGHSRSAPAATTTGTAGYPCSAPAAPTAPAPGNRVIGVNLRNLVSRKFHWRRRREGNPAAGCAGGYRLNLNFRGLGRCLLLSLGGLHRRRIRLRHHVFVQADDHPAGKEQKYQDDNRRLGLGVILTHGKTGTGRSLNRAAQGGVGGKLANSG